MVNTSEVLPALMRGRGMPVGGMLPLTTRALTSTCTAYEAEMPAASKKPNRSRLRPAAAMPCQMRATAAASSSNTPQKPSSSPMTARMKSDSAKGR